MVRRSRIAIIVVLVLAAAGCQNWDLLEPEETGSSSRTFTRLDGDEPQQLTNAVAIRRVREIEQATGAERVELIDEFVEAFPTARMIPQVHRLRGEALLTEAKNPEAAGSFERALVLTRTDLLGMPLESDLPLQLGMALLSAGDSEGLRWLGRVSLVDHSEQVQQSLRWAHAQEANVGFDEWLADLRAEWMVEAPGFDLPGLLSDTVSYSEVRGRATLINFWSPT